MDAKELEQLRIDLKVMKVALENAIARLDKVDIDEVERQNEIKAKRRSAYLKKKLEREERVRRVMEKYRRKWTK